MLNVIVMSLTLRTLEEWFELLHEIDTLEVLSNEAKKKNEINHKKWQKNESIKTQIQFEWKSYRWRENIEKTE